MEQEYAQVVRDIYELQKFRGKISLEPIQELTAQLDHPEQDFPAIHVAGTNGKGSTASMLAAVLSEEGERTGLFTSPHLVDFRERIQVDGEKISREDVVRAYERVSGVGTDMSFFECMAAMAFDHFSRKEVDVAVVETGMGGRIDATNVAASELSVVTNVAREHTKWLGETPEQIAHEIGGIIREETPVVSGADGDPGRVIETIAEAKDAPLVPVEQLARPVDDGSTTLTLDWDGTRIDTDLLGRYQVDNINTMLTAVEAMDRAVSDAAVRSALERVELPGRMEAVSSEPLVLLDCAHNPAAVRRLPATLSRIDGGKTVVVASIMADKDYGAMLSTVEEFADLVILSEAGIDRAADAEDLAACVDRVDCEVVPSIPDALDTALKVAAPDDLVLVTGSLYFVGDVKKVMDVRVTSSRR
ncbi:MAG: folylpolyglutamate synthase/dihydrofolate synthase family protein [Candidatus Nanohaloarchaea archaeon]|nr:folylpolyglutamate synthase/dihydrofolate synthase family protein [Candidatus Nanohaloarchaea archaeon]